MRAEKIENDLGRIRCFSNNKVDLSRINTYAVNVSFDNNHSKFDSCKEIINIANITLSSNKRFVPLTIASEMHTIT